MGWKPIETAVPFDPFENPDDDPPRLILWVENGGSDGKGDWTVGWVRKSRDGTILPRPSNYIGDGWVVSHWMPEPTPPKE